MRRTNLKTSMLISLSVLALMLWAVATLACEPTGYHVPVISDRCGSYGCVNGRPAVVIPGYPNGGPYPPTVIIIKK